MKAPQNNTMNPTSASANGLQRSRVIVVLYGPTLTDLLFLRANAANAVRRSASLSSRLVVAPREPRSACLGADRALANSPRELQKSLLIHSGPPRYACGWAHSKAFGRAVFVASRSDRGVLRRGLCHAVVPRGLARRAAAPFAAMAATKATYTSRSQ